MCLHINQSLENGTLFLTALHQNSASDLGSTNQKDLCGAGVQWGVKAVAYEVPFY